MDKTLESTGPHLLNQYLNNTQLLLLGSHNLVKIDEAVGNNPDDLAYVASILSSIFLSRTLTSEDVDRILMQINNLSTNSSEKKIEETDRETTFLDDLLYRGRGRPKLETLESCRNEYFKALHENRVLLAALLKSQQTIEAIKKMTQASSIDINSLI